MTLETTTTTTTEDCKINPSANADNDEGTPDEQGKRYPPHEGARDCAPHRQRKARRSGFKRVYSRRTHPNRSRAQDGSRRLDYRSCKELRIVK